MNVSFSEYLEAKVHLDDESLHPKTLALFERLLSREDPLVVDLGTGTGAMIRRLVRRTDLAAARYIGIDSDEAGLRIAEERTGELLADRGPSGDGAAQRTRVGYRRGDLLSADTARLLRELSPAAITAHAVMDCLPLSMSLPPIAAALRSGGLFYASLNYDGRTDILPTYRDRRFERLIESVYDASMEERTVSGEPIAGAQSGRRLYNALTGEGLTPISVGSSDWSLTPENGRYRPHVRTVLLALLETIHREMLTQRTGGRPLIRRGATKPPAVPSAGFRSSACRAC